jgi:peptidyl-prolyl cis-trans isomerase C
MPEYNSGMFMCVEVQLRHNQEWRFSHEFCLSSYDKGKNMKKLVIGTMICVWVALGLGVVIGAEADTAVAKVNAVDIWQSEVDFIITMFVLPQFQAQTQQKEIPKDQLKMVEQNILNQLILQKLLVQKAVQLKITVDEELLAQQMESAKQMMPDVALDQLRQLLTDDLLARQVIEQEVVAKISVSDEEVQKFYDENPQQFTEPEQVQASHILVTVESDASQEEKDAAQQKIGDILTQVNAGGDFAELAKEHSDCPSKEQGGDLGFFARGQMVKPFEDAAFAMNEGAISEIVETQFGYHIIKVTGKKPENKMLFEDVQEQIEQSLLDQKTNTEINTWVTDLRANADVEILIQEPPTEEETPEPAKEEIPEPAKEETPTE